MSNRPDWCPADVWEVAHDVNLDHLWACIDDDPDDVKLYQDTASIARAILAERERCAAIADDHGKAWGLAMGQQAHEIACAIRRDPQA